MWEKHTILGRLGEGGGSGRALKKKCECWPLFHVPPPPWLVIVTCGTVRQCWTVITSVGWCQAVIVNMRQCQTVIVTCGRALDSDSECGTVLVSDSERWRVLDSDSKCGTVLDSTMEHDSDTIGTIIIYNFGDVTMTNYD